METQTEKKPRGGARPNCGRKLLNKETKLINFRIDADLHNDLKQESNRRREAGEESLNAEFVKWAKKKTKK